MPWPDRGYPSQMDVRIAGCGTNQAAVFASDNPSALVVAIDVSRQSLDHHEPLKSHCGLDSLVFHPLPLEDVTTLGRDVDLIVSTGVLRHLADPRAGAKAVASCPGSGGGMGLTPYACIGRIGVEIRSGDPEWRSGVEMMDAVFGDLDLRPAEHPVRHDLVEQAGLAFQGWFPSSPCEPKAPPAIAFTVDVTALSDHRRWSVMERISTRNGRHFFLARHPEDSVLAAVDLASHEATSLVPVFRHRCGAAGSEVVRPAGPIPVDPAQRAIADQIDGRRTIRQIAATALEADRALFDSAAAATTFACAAVPSLHDRDASAVMAAPDSSR